MPVYEYRCTDCAELTDAYRFVEDRDKCPECPVCGGTTHKIISTSYAVHGDFDPYYDDNLETHIRSKSHRKRVMKEQGVEEVFGQNWHTSAIKKRSTV